MEIALAKLICEKAQKGARDQSNNIGFATYARYVRLNRRLYGLSRAELETELNLSSGYITLLENGLLLTNELPKQMRSNMVDYFHRQDTRRYKMK